MKKRRKERPGAIFLLAVTGVAGAAAGESTVVVFSSGIAFSINN